jgi:hypothetical protein
MLGGVQDKGNGTECKENTKKRKIRGCREGEK